MLMSHQSSARWERTLQSDNRRQPWWLLARLSCCTGPLPKPASCPGQLPCVKAEPERLRGWARPGGELCPG